MKKKIVHIIWFLIGLLYSPIYVGFWVLHKVARLILAISYFGLLNWQSCIDILKNLFSYGRKY